MEHVACDLCGGTTTQPVLTKDHWRIVQCSDCGLAYLNPRPLPVEIEERYDWFDHAPRQTRERRAQEGSSRRFFRRLRGRGLLRRKPREEVVRDRITGFVDTGRFLDVGCGDGFMVEAMRDAGFAADGIDISPRAVEEAHRCGRTTVRRARIFDDALDRAAYDAVLLMSYLEHEPHPTLALGRVAELLAPGGHVFIKVPHFDSWNRRVLKADWSGYFFPQHLFYFTPDTAVALLEKCGFEIVQNRFWDHVPVSDVFWITARRPVHADVESSKPRPAEERVESRAPSRPAAFARPSELSRNELRRGQA